MQRTGQALRTIAACSRIGVKKGILNLFETPKGEDAFSQQVTDWYNDTVFSRIIMTVLPEKIHSKHFVMMTDPAAEASMRETVLNKYIPLLKRTYALEDVAKQSARGSFAELQRALDVIAEELQASPPIKSYIALTMSGAAAAMHANDFKGKPESYIEQKVPDDAAAMLAEMHEELKKCGFKNGVKKLVISTNEIPPRTLKTLGAISKRIGHTPETDGRVR